MKKWSRIEPVKGLELKVGDFHATISLGKRFSGKGKHEKSESVAICSIGTPGLFKKKLILVNGKEEQIEKVLTFSVPASRNQAKKLIVCFNALENQLQSQKEKTVIKIINRSTI